MFRNKRNILLGIGLSAALAVSCGSPEYDDTETATTTDVETETTTETNQQYGQTDQYGQNNQFSQTDRLLNKDQAKELNEVVKNLFEHVNKADMAIANNNNDEAKDAIEEANSQFEDLKNKAQEFGMAALGSQFGSQSNYQYGSNESATQNKEYSADESATSGTNSDNETTYSRGSDDQMSQNQTYGSEAKTLFGNQVIRIPVYEGNQLVSFTRLVSEARQENGSASSSTYGHGDMSKDKSKTHDHDDMMSKDKSKTYGHDDMSKDKSHTYGDDNASSGSMAGDDQYGSGSTTYGRGTMNTADYSFVVINLADLSQNLSQAVQAAQNDQIQQAEQAIENIQSQAVDIEYGTSAKPLKRIGEKMATVKVAVENENFEEARASLQEVDSELSEFANNASNEVQTEVEEMRTDIQNWGNQLDQNADEAGDKLEGWWNQMSGWFNTEIAAEFDTETESTY